MNLLKWFLFYLVGKPIKINVMDILAKYYVTELRIQKNWDGTESLEIILKTTNCLKAER